MYKFRSFLQLRLQVIYTEIDYKTLMKYKYQYVLHKYMSVVSKLRKFAIMLIKFFLSIFIKLAMKILQFYINKIYL